MIAGLILITACFAQDPVFSAGVASVRVDAQVTRDGKTVAGLSINDFLVKENGRPVRIEQVAGDEAPLDVLFLLDVSGSMRIHLQELAAASQTALEVLQPGDRAGIAVFHTEVGLVSPFTTNRADTRQALMDVAREKPGGGTDIYRAVFGAADYFQKNPSLGRRRAVLLFTDNIGEESMPEQQVSEALWKADAVLDALIVNVNLRIQAMGTGLGKTDVKKIIQATGGESWPAEHAALKLRDALERMRQRYSLFYTPAAGSPGEVRKIEVQLSRDARRLHRGAKIESRKGYVYEK